MNVCKEDSIEIVPEVGNGTKVRGVCSSSTSSGLRPLLFDFGVSKFFGCVRGEFRGSGDERKDLNGALGIDFVSRIRGPVIVGMKAGKEKQRGNAFTVERQVVATFVPSIGQGQRKSNLFVRVLNPRRKLW